MERHRCDGGRSHALQAYRDLFAAQGLRLGEPISAGTPILAITDLLDTLLGLRGAREPVGAAPVELPWRARTGTYSYRDDEREEVMDALRGIAAPP